MRLDYGSYRDFNVGIIFPFLPVSTRNLCGWLLG